MFTFCLGTFQKLNFSKCNASKEVKFVCFFFFWYRMEVDFGFMMAHFHTESILPLSKTPLQTWL